MWWRNYNYSLGDLKWPIEMMAGEEDEFIVLTAVA